MRGNAMPPSAPDEPGLPEQPGPPGSLLAALRTVCRVRHYALRTTEVYTHVLNRGVRGVLNPLDS